MEADEQVAALGTVGATIPQRDEGIGGSRHPDGDAAPLQLLAEQESNLKGDIFLARTAREERAGISRVDSTVPRVDRDDVSGPEPVGQPGGRIGSRHGGREPGRHLRRHLVEPPGAIVVPVSLSQVVRQNLRDELEREEERVSAPWRPGRRGAAGVY